MWRSGRAKDIMRNVAGINRGPRALDRYIVTDLMEAL